MYERPLPTAEAEADADADAEVESLRWIHSGRSGNQVASIQPRFG